MRMGLPMGDLSGGMFGAFAVAGALFRRERSGRGPTWTCRCSTARFPC